MKKINLIIIKMRPFSRCFIFLLIFLISCAADKKKIVVYQRFDEQKWHRFDKLMFVVPVGEENKEYDVFFFIKHSKKCQVEKIDFGMIMNTPSGEERINQYSLMIQRKRGEFSGQCDLDTCYTEIALKKGLYISKKGILSIEIESLVPRLEITELFGAGIKVVPKG